MWTPPRIIRAMENDPKAARREYKRQWMAAKRSAQRAAVAERVTLDIPKAMAARLRRQKPAGMGFAAYLLQCLKGFQTAQRALGAELATSSFGRNQPCPCESGKKFKHCCANL